MGKGAPTTELTLETVQEFVADATKSEQIKKPLSEVAKQAIRSAGFRLVHEQVGGVILNPFHYIVKEGDQMVYTIDSAGVDPERNARFFLRNEEYNLIRNEEVTQSGKAWVSFSERGVLEELNLITEVDA